MCCQQIDHASTPRPVLRIHIPADLKALLSYVSQHDAVLPSQSSPQVNDHRVWVFHKSSNYLRSAAHSRSINNAVICTPTEIAHLFLDQLTRRVESWNGPRLADA